MPASQAGRRRFESGLPLHKSIGCEIQEQAEAVKSEIETRLDSRTRSTGWVECQLRNNWVRSFGGRTRMSFRHRRVGLAFPVISYSFCRSWRWFSLTYARSCACLLSHMVNNVIRRLAQRTRYIFGLYPINSQHKDLMKLLDKHQIALTFVVPGVQERMAIG